MEVGCPQDQHKWEVKTGGLHKNCNTITTKSSAKPVLSSRAVMALLRCSVQREGTVHCISLHQPVIGGGLPLGRVRQFSLVEDNSPGAAQLRFVSCQHFPKLGK